MANWSGRVQILINSEEIRCTNINPGLIMKLYLQISENKLGIMEMQNTFPLAKTQSKVCDSHYCHFVGVVSPSEERVQVALEELHDLKGVWVELSKIWEQIDELREKTWLSVAPRKVNKTPVHLCPSLTIFVHQLSFSLQFYITEYTQVPSISYLKLKCLNASSKKQELLQK